MGYLRVKLMMKKASTKIILLAAILTMSAGSPYMFADPEPNLNPVVGPQPVIPIVDLAIPGNQLTPYEAGEIVDTHNLTQFNITATSNSALDLESQVRWQDKHQWILRKGLIAKR